MRAANGREAALEAMRRQRRAGAYSADAVDAVIREAALEPREAAFCTRIVRETLQNLYFIDHDLDLWCKTPTKRLEPAVLDILRIWPSCGNGVDNRMLCNRCGRSYWDKSV